MGNSAAERIFRKKKRRRIRLSKLSFEKKIKILVELQIVYSFPGNVALAIGEILSLLLQNETRNHVTLFALFSGCISPRGSIVYVICRIVSTTISNGRNYDVSRVKAFRTRSTSKDIFIFYVPKAIFRK